MEYQLSDFKCCPKCTTKGSPGLLVREDVFFEKANTWLHFIKCVNCSWQYEIKQMRRPRKVMVTK